MWISTAVHLLIMLAPPLATPDCISIADYQRAPAVVQLRGVDLYASSSPERVGRLVELDLSRNPPTIRFEGVAPRDLESVCVLRDDVELKIAYQLDVIAQDWDGVACVTFDEGRPHSLLFQRREHNQGQEVRLYPFGRVGAQWRRIDARAGFAHEAFAFERGITVGDAGLLKALKNSSLDGSDTVVRAGSPLASEPGFNKKSESRSVGGQQSQGRAKVKATH